MRWHKVDNERWLTGSIRTDMTPDQRSVWADFLALAGKSRRQGFIERTEGEGFSLDWLANFLVISRELLDQTIAICLSEGRLDMDGDGVMMITNWEHYQGIPEDKVKRVFSDKEREHIERTKLAQLAEKYPGDTLQHKIRAMAKNVKHFDAKTGEELPSDHLAVQESVYLAHEGKVSGDGHDSPVTTP